MTHQNELEATIAKIIEPGKGILAADESMPTITKRFTAVGIESSEDSRRAYRTLLFTTPGAEEYLSGVILFEETLAQNADDGTALPQVLANHGILPGIKVDKGTTALAGRARRPDHAGARWTCGAAEGRTGRRARVSRNGARFTRITDRNPTDARHCGQRGGARALRRDLPGRGPRADRRA